MSEDGSSRTVAPEGGDVDSPSKHSTSRKRIKIIPPKLGGNSRMMASEGGDVSSPSNHSTLTKRIRFRPEPGPGKGPRVSLRYFNGLCVKEDISRWVGIALSSFNETNRAPEAPLYELVEVLGGVFTIRLVTYHFNFIARPKNGTEDENMLFFAEVKLSQYAPYCLCCCILGPPGSETGHDCYLNCYNFLGHVQHPEGGFTKKIGFK